MLLTHISGNREKYAYCIQSTAPVQSGGSAFGNRTGNPGSEIGERIFQNHSKLQFTKTKLLYKKAPCSAFIVVGGIGHNLNHYCWKKCNRPLWIVDN